MLSGIYSVLQVTSGIYSVLQLQLIPIVTQQIIFDSKNVNSITEK